MARVDVWKWLPIVNATVGLILLATSAAELNLSATLGWTCAVLANIQIIGIKWFGDP